MNTSADTATTPDPANAPDLELDVLGMSCSACVRRIENAVRKVPGVSAAHVNLATRKASVRFDERRTSAETIARAVRNAGYEIAQGGSSPEASVSGARADREQRARAIEAAERAEHASVKRDLVLAAGLTSGISGLPTAFALARRTLRTIRENLFWAFIYNILGIPIAAGALYVINGWQLSPVLASAAMSLSSVSVLANSLRLRRFSLTRPAMRAAAVRPD